MTSQPTRIRVDSRSGAYSVYFDDGAKLPKSPEKQRIPRDRARQFGARIIRESISYNCAGLVLGMRKGWLVHEEGEFESVVTKALQEEGFMMIPVASADQYGDVIGYQTDFGDLVHVGFVLGYPEIAQGARGPLEVLSKWGEFAECVHRIDNVADECGKPAVAWRQRFAR